MVASELSWPSKEAGEYEHEPSLIIALHV